MLQYVIAHKFEIVTILLAVSECLALIPSVKSNSIFQLVVNLLKKQAPAQGFEAVVIPIKPEEEEEKKAA